MSYAYAVLGAGRQATAAAYDITICGDARRVLLADYDLDVARQSAERVNKLTGKAVCGAIQVDVTDLEAVEWVTLREEGSSRISLLEAMEVLLGREGKSDSDEMAERSASRTTGQRCL